MNFILLVYLYTKGTTQYIIILDFILLHITNLSDSKRKCSADIFRKGKKMSKPNFTGIWVLFTWASSLRCFASRRNLTASKLKPSTPFVSQNCIIS